MADTKHDISVLNGLIATTLDSVDGYTEALDSVDGYTDDNALTIYPDHPVGAAHSGF